MSYKRIPYSSFLWKFGTTSFRTKEFNRMTEWQLRLIDEFWAKPEYAHYGWENKYMFPGQNGIYWIKCRYYDWLVENNFMEGGEPEERKFKTAREKTSGLYDMGFLNENHRLTPAGRHLLEIVDNEENLLQKNQLGISLDSQIYLEQLLKLSSKDTGTTVRPLIVVLYLISKLDYLSNEEFTYLMPLCTDEFSTNYILECIKELRAGNSSIDKIIEDFLLFRGNYQIGLRRFCGNNFSERLLLSVGMNRKSQSYDKPYAILYKELHSVYLDKDYTRIYPLFLSLKRFQSSIRIKWKQLLFDTSSETAIKNDPKGHLLPLPESAVQSESNFKRFFYLTMHLNKAKATLEDYKDLNRRYLGLTNCFIFEDNQVKLDIVPKHFFSTTIDKLYEQAFTANSLLEQCSSLSEICPALIFDDKKVIDSINQDLGTSVTTIEEAYNEVDRVRYERFNKLVDQKFTDENLLSLLDDFENRRDDIISDMVTDNADTPTIFEYILGIIWWKISGKKGKILDYLKLSLDANLLPITHAAGGEADIVYDYSQCNEYPEHSVLLEATLADGANQRRMEMEPVSRHLGNHLLRTQNLVSFCVFVTTFLHINVLADFRARKSMIYYDPQDFSKSVNGMKIIPIDTNDLKQIIKQKIDYIYLYKRFDEAFRSDEIRPLEWYNDYVKIQPATEL